VRASTGRDGAPTQKVLALRVLARGGAREEARVGVYGKENQKEIGEQGREKEVGRRCGCNARRRCGQYCGVSTVLAGGLHVLSAKLGLAGVRAMGRAMDKGVAAAVLVGMLRCCRVNANGLI
jgi:hypothetical protein